MQNTGHKKGHYSCHVYVGMLPPRMARLTTWPANLPAPRCRSQQTQDVQPLASCHCQPSSSQITPPDPPACPAGCRLPLVRPTAPRPQNSRGLRPQPASPRRPLVRLTNSEACYRKARAAEKERITARCAVLFKTILPQAHAAFSLFSFKQFVPQETSRYRFTNVVMHILIPVSFETKTRTDLQKVWGKK